MKKKTNIICVLLGFLIFGVGCLFWNSCSLSKAPARGLSHFKYTHAPYYSEIQVTEFTDGNVPCIPVHVGNLTVLMKLDTGMRRSFSLPLHILDRIEEKKFVCLEQHFGIRGKAYEGRVYEVPSIGLIKMIHRSVRVREESEEFLRDSTVWIGDSKPPSLELGTIGAGAFRWCNLFLDLGNFRIATVDSLNTLQQQQRYQGIEFIKTPLLTDGGFLEIQAQSPQGSLRYLLDTGSSWNGINAGTDQNQTIEEAMLDPKNLSIDVFLFLEGSKIGPLKFLHIPIPENLPARIEGILGAPFFQDHLVFFDFAEGYVYIAPRPLR